MSDFTAGLGGPFEEYRKQHLDEIMRQVDFIGRNGATNFEIGWEPPDERPRWYVKVTFKQGTLLVEDYDTPMAALQAAVSSLQEEARCAHCHRLIAWGMTTSRTKCAFYLDEDKNWRPGCLRGQQHVLSEAGDDDARALGKLPPKKPGKHRLIATAGYSITEEQAGMGSSVVLDHENRFVFGVGCVDCEMAWPELQNVPCPADDDWDHEPPSTRVVDVAAVEPDDPKEMSTSAGPSGEGPVSADAVRKSILLEGVGVQAVHTGRHNSDEVDTRLVVSFVGRQNRSKAQVHHMYLVDGGMAGLLVAQMMSIVGVFGTEFTESFDERMQELQSQGLLGPNPFTANQE